MFGEIFQGPSSEVDAGLLKRLHGADVAQALDQEIFGRRPPWLQRARGFKMFYEHARANPAQKAAWTHLIDSTDIKVIHLIRRNLLDCKISLEVAIRTDEWLLSRGESSSAPTVAPFSISPWDCQSYFGQITTDRMWAVKAFADHPVLTLEYEKDLCGDFAGAMARVFAFLKVPAIPVTPQTVKQQARVSADIVLNYAELRHCFRHTLYEEYFAPEGAVQ